MMNSTISNSRSVLKKVGIGFFWLALWETLFRVVNKELLIPSPVQVATRLRELGGNFVFWKILASSCFRVLAGLVLAVLIGSIMGILCSRFSLLQEIFQPILRMITTTPVASFIILAAVWITSRRIPVVITILMVTPLVWNNVYQGLTSVDKELVELLDVYHITGKKRWQVLYLPTLRPYLTAAFTTGVGFAWKAGVAAEVIVRPKNSIGGEIYNAKTYLETTNLFAWTVVVILLSFLLERLSLLLLKKLGFSKRKETP